MNLKFLTPDLSDKRIVYAGKYLEDKGYTRVEKKENADFVLLGVNPDKSLLEYHTPIFAGNIRADNVYDYTKVESFAVKNAFLTAEGAVSLATEKSERSLIGSSVLITGYGRIGKALQLYLMPYSSDITVCARDINARAIAKSLKAKTLSFNELKENSAYDFIFNTVPHPVFGAGELSSVNQDALIIDLASFPGGVDKHIARVKNLKLISARGLPSVYSPITAGEVVGETVLNMIKEVIV